MKNVFKNGNILWETVVGSHMWNMNHEGSDVDIFRCYIEDTKNILMEKHPKTDFIQQDNVDVQIHELGKTTDEIIKSNLNYLGYIFSPVIKNDELHILNIYREFAYPVLSRNAYNSIYGMAVGNYKKYHEDMTESRYNKICRILQFGITLFKTGDILFAPVYGGTESMYYDLLDKLRVARDESRFPQNPDKEAVDRLREYVLVLRLQKGEIEGLFEL